MSELTQDLIMEENEQILQRKSKLKKWRVSHQAFPNDFVRKYLARDLHSCYEKCSAEDLEKQALVVSLAGRMMTRRLMGKACFANLQDMSGKIQLYVAKDLLTENDFEEFKTFDLGDILGVTGLLFKTKTGELSVKVKSLRLLTKALRPLPDKFHGLQDQEQRFRKRYLDLMMNVDSRNIFQIRSQLIASIRRFLNARQFLEVETPMMHILPGGAAARPFMTHHNTLDMDLFLRIAPELYLKRLVVGGIEKVYEINRNFRNEGLSTRHNPEFTMLEFYEAYSTYDDLMNLTEEMLRSLAQTVLGQLEMIYQGEVIDLKRPFVRMTLRDSILQLNPDIQTQQIDNLDLARKLALSLKIEIPQHYGLGKIQQELFEKLVEKKLTQPTFITEFPKEVSPLARANDHNTFVTDRFEFFIGGQEIANGFSELNDPEDQAARFKQQLLIKETGDQEAMGYDEDYIQALEYGLPPTAGEGIGIDRLVMIFTNSPSIREVILFPLLREKH